MKTKQLAFFTALLSAGIPVLAQDVPTNPTRETYFGNFHVHTGYSFDGYANGSRTTPNDAFH